MSSTVGGFGRLGQGLLVKKLDMAMQTLAHAKVDERLSDAEQYAAHQLQAHVPVYAGIVTDLQSGRINAADPMVAKLLGLAEEFCALVSSTFPLATIPKTNS